jgi:hypothetical protein
MLGLRRARWMVLAPLLWSATAVGRSEAESAYTKTQTYHAALRYLRVDLDYEITERDPDAAYLLFRYVPPGRKRSENGAIEIVETPRTVKVFVQLPKMPSYHEQVLKDGLMKKLGDEYGAPPKRKKERRSEHEGAKGDEEDEKGKE